MRYGGVCRETAASPNRYKTKDKSLQYLLVPYRLDRLGSIDRTEAGSHCTTGFSYTDNLYADDAAQPMPLSAVSPNKDGRNYASQSAMASIHSRCAMETMTNFYSTRSTRVACGDMSPLAALTIMAYTKVGDNLSSFPSGM